MYSLPIIGSIIQRPSVIDSVLEHIRPEMLDSAKAKHTLRAMVMMNIAGEPIDIVTVSHKVKEFGVDAVWLTSCIDNAVPANAGTYAKSQYEYWAKRELKDMVERLSFDAPLNNILADLSNIQNDFESNFVSGARPSAEAGAVVEDYLRWIAGIRDKKIKTIPCHTPGLYDPIDNYRSVIPFWIGGLYVIISAYSTVGKSAYLTTLAAREAEAGANVVIFSNEMGRFGYAARFAAYYSDIPYGHILQNKIDGRQEKEIDEALIRYSSLPIRIYEHTRNIAQVKQTIKKLSYSIKPDIVIVDYLQNIVDKSGDVKAQLDKASQELMQLAQDMDCSVVVASQVDNNQAKSGDQAPNFMAVKGSGDVSADAVVFIELTRDTLNADQEKQRIITRTVKKNREFGRVGRKDIYFNKSFTRIENENN